MEWISVKDNLPKRDEDVLIHCKSEPVKYPNGIYIGHLSNTEDEPTWQNEDYETMDGVTHWMILPNPPKTVL